MRSRLLQLRAHGKMRKMRKKNRCRAWVCACARARSCAGAHAIKNWINWAALSCVCKARDSPYLTEGRHSGNKRVGSSKMADFDETRRKCGDYIGCSRVKIFFWKFSLFWREIWISKSAFLYVVNAWKAISRPVDDLGSWFFACRSPPGAPEISEFFSEFFPKISELWPILSEKRPLFRGQKVQVRGWIRQGSLKTNHCFFIDLS